MAARSSPYTKRSFSGLMTRAITSFLISISSSFARKRCLSYWYRVMISGTSTQSLTGSSIRSLLSLMRPLRKTMDDMCPSPTALKLRMTRF